MRAVSFLLPAVAIMASAPVLAADPHPASLAGVYDGGQMEMAAGLELTKDGKFRYMLSYGALDEAAAGTWSATGNAVTLNVIQYESNDPSGDGKFGPSVLQLEDGDLILPRYDRVLRFSKQKR
jgi:hypothetical protein